MSTSRNSSRIFPARLPCTTFSSATSRSGGMRRRRREDCCRVACSTIMASAPPACCGAATQKARSLAHSRATRKCWTKRMASSSIPPSPRRSRHSASHAIRAFRSHVPRYADRSRRKWIAWPRARASASMPKHSSCRRSASSITSSSCASWSRHGRAPAWRRSARGAS